jgi:hypothetical protein
MTEARFAGVSRKMALPLVFCCLTGVEWSSSSPVSQSFGGGLGEREYLSSPPPPALVELEPVSTEDEVEGSPSNAYFMVIELSLGREAAGGFKDALSRDSGWNDAESQCFDL